MKVAIVHYHLGHGGVPMVIASASRTLTASDIPHIILAGPSSAPDLPLCVIEDLGYAGTADADDLLSRLRSAAIEKLGGPPDIWHFHNHSLGKNPAVPRIVARLASEGERLLLQIHDLAEDGRPENASRLTDRNSLYPAGPRIHYAFINSRDRDHFINSGLPETNAHLLPNSVDFKPTSPAPSGAPLLLYPVRGIRRKNLGELLLLAALAPPGTRVAITRAPLNPDAIITHDAWRRFSEDMRLPVEFDVVDRTAPETTADSTFDAWIANSTHLVTTSVSEGFGMVFPESVARCRPLLGRNLPHLTRDHGISTGRLYDKLSVPPEWIDSRILRQCRDQAMDKLWRAWDRQPPSVVSTSGSLDFGNLPEILQQRVIRKVTEPGMRLLPQVEIGGITSPAAKWLAETLAWREPASVETENQRNELTGIYQQLMDEAHGQTACLDSDIILDAYLTPENFHFLTSPAIIRNPRPDFMAFRAIIFDVYGTLLAAPAGGVKPDPAADALLHEILTRHGHAPPFSPSAALHDAARRHHASAQVRYPEVDLRNLWRELLALPADADTTQLVIEIESAWHPARLMPGVKETLHHFAANGITLGLLSNAQCDTLPSLGGCAALFPPDLAILSYQQGIAKPSPELFDLLATRLAQRGISPAESLYIGNDPLHDIEPAAARGFRTALFTGDPDSRRDGFCFPDYEISDWSALHAHTNPPTACVPMGFFAGM
jgi:FMN phosphatase YigB (HAD superfamily)